MPEGPDPAQFNLTEVNAFLVKTFMVQDVTGSQAKNSKALLFPRVAGGFLQQIELMGKMSSGIYSLIHRKNCSAKLLKSCTGILDCISIALYQS